MLGRGGQPWPSLPIVWKLGRAGGGPAGVEVAANLRRLAHGAGEGAEVTLVSREPFDGPVTVRGGGGERVIAHDLAAMLLEVTALLRTHKLALPSELALLVKVFITLEGPEGAG